MNQSSTNRPENDLSSGMFQTVVSNLTGRTLTQIRERDEILSFFQVLFIGSKELLVKVATSEGLVFDQTILKKDETFIIKDSTFDIDLDFEGERTIYFNWLNTTYCFFTLFKKNESGLFFEIPEKIFLVHRRRLDRLTFKDNSTKITIDAPNTFSVGIIKNISPRGFAVTVNHKELNFQLFDAITVFFLDNCRVFVEILHINHTEDSTIIGCRVFDESLDEYKRWITEIVPFFFPNVVKVQSRDDRSDLAKVFQNSLLGGHFSPSSFLVASEQKQPKGSFFLLKDGDRPCAALATHQIYSKTWLIYTLGLTKDFSTRLPNNLFNRISWYLTGENSATYLSGFWPSQTKLFDRSYTAFALKDFNPSDHHLETIDILQFKSKNLSKSDFPDGIKCELAHPNDWLKIREIIQSNYSVVYQDALDLNSGFEEVLNGDFINGNKRFILVAKKTEKILGIAILECTKNSPLTFGLSNTFRFIFEDGVDQSVVSQILFENSLSLYNQEKISVCTLYLAKEHKFLCPKFKEPVARLENIYFWIVRNTRMKAFIRHLDRLDWELKFLEKNKANIKPSLLKKIRFNTEPFKRRRCSRLEDYEQLKVVRCEIILGDDRSIPVILTSLDTFGFSVEIPPDIQIAKGDVLNLKLNIPGEPQLEIKSEVQFVVDKPAPGFSHFKRFSGFKFLSGTENSYKILREFTFRKLNSELNIYQAPDFKPLTDLFETSKYFDYYEGADHQKFIEEGRGTYSNLDHLYPDLIRTTVLKDQNKVLGTHSFYRLTPKTWQLHQLVVDEKLGLYKAKIPTKVVLQGSFQYLTLDPSADYFVTYFSDQASIAKTYFEVRNHHDNPQDYAFVSYRGFVFENVERSNFSVSGKFEVGEADEEEILQIQGYLATLISKLEYEALNYHDLTQIEFLDSWKQKGFLREQKVFVIKNKNKDILHFAIANLSPLGANIISFLDIFRVFDLPWCGETPESARFDLINFVVGYYQKQGRTQVYLEVDEGVGNLYLSLPARDLGKNWRLIAFRPSFMTALTFFIGRFEKLEKRLVQHAKSSI